MHLHVTDHPLINHKLTVLRDCQTLLATFRQFADKLITLFAYEATCQVSVTGTAVNIPVAPAVGHKLSEPRPIVAPVPHAGLDMLEDMTRPLSTAKVDFFDIRCNDDILEIETYANHLPDGLFGRQCFVLDPILATGHTMVAMTNYLFECGAKDVTCVHLFVAPEDLAVLEKAVGDRGDVNVTAAAIDDHLSEESCIVSGLGGVGGRLCDIID